jgi:ABC-2 type transport system ATP-binding protein
MDEAQFLADRVAVIASGEIVAEGTPDSLGNRRTAHSIITFSTAALGELSLPVRGAVVAGAGSVQLRSDDPTQDLHTITGWALENDIELVDLSVRRPSLEDVYLELTGGDVDG